MSGHLHFIITEDSGKTYNIPFSKKKFKIASATICISLVILTVAAVTSLGLWTTNRHINNKLSNIKTELTEAQKLALETEQRRKEQELALSLQVANLEKDNIEQAAAFKEEKAQLMSSAISELQERSEAIESVMGGIGIDVGKITPEANNSGGPYISLPESGQDDLLLRADKYLEMLRSLPIGRPVAGAITSRYGKRKDPLKKGTAFHTGIDFRGKRGEKIYATGDGVVTKAQYNGSYGNYVEISHGNGYKTSFAHMKKYLVEKGDQIHRGQVVGLVGNSGRSTGPHLHYEIHLNKKTVNPYKFLTNQVPKTRRLLAQKKNK